MTIQQQECALCSSILDAPTANLSPEIHTALAFVDYWESPEARQVALGIRKAMEAKRPTHRVVVGLLMDREYREWLKHPTFNDGLPLSCVDVKPLLEHYRDKRIVDMLGKAYVSAKEHPNVSGFIASRLVGDLEEVL